MPFKAKKPAEETPFHVPDESHAPPAEDEGNWLVSYADMMTLLCGFFIMLFSMSKLETPKYDAFKSAMVQQFGGEYVSATKELAKFATQVLQEMGVEQIAIIKADDHGVSIVFESMIFFDTLSSDVRPEGKKILNHLIESVAKRQKATAKIYKIVVEGHTDSRPVIGGAYPSNWELSGARAARVVRMFLDYGFPPDHLTAIGYGDTHPKFDERTPSGKWDDKALSKNRRVVLRILEPTVDGIPFPEGGKTSPESPPVGPNGPNGSNGPSSTNSPSGPSNTNGPSGASGGNGVSGPNGLNGSSGPNALNGPSGGPNVGTPPAPIPGAPSGATSIPPAQPLSTSPVQPASGFTLPGTAVPAQPVSTFTQPLSAPVQAPLAPTTADISKTAPPTIPAAAPPNGPAVRSP